MFAPFPVFEKARNSWSRTREGIHDRRPAPRHGGIERTLAGRSSEAAGEAKDTARRTRVSTLT